MLNLWVWQPDTSKNCFFKYSEYHEKENVSKDKEIHDFIESHINTFSF